MKRPVEGGRYIRDGKNGKLTKVQTSAPVTVVQPDEAPVANEILKKGK